MGHPVRSLRTPFAREYQVAEEKGMPDEELEALGTGTLRLAAKEGDAEKGCFLAGQVASMINKEQPAAQIISEVVNEAETILKGAGKWVN